MHESNAPRDSLLIVEDEPKIARLVADYLEGSGFATHAIAHGDEVLPWLQEHMEHEERPRWCCST